MRELDHELLVAPFQMFQYSTTDWVLAGKPRQKEHAGAVIQAPCENETQYGMHERYICGLIFILLNIFCGLLHEIYTVTMTHGTRASVR